MQQRNKMVAGLAGAALSMAAVTVVLTMLHTERRPEAVSTRQSASPTSAAQLIAGPAVPTPWLTPGTDGQLQPATLTTTGPDGQQISATVMATTGPDGRATPLPVRVGPTLAIDPSNGATVEVPRGPVGTIVLPSAPNSTTPPPAATPPNAQTSTRSPVPEQPSASAPGQPSVPATTPPATTATPTLDPVTQPPQAGVAVHVITVAPLVGNAAQFSAALDAAPPGSIIQFSLPAQVNADSVDASLVATAAARGLTAQVLLTGPLTPSANLSQLAATVGPSVSTWQLLTSADTIHYQTGLPASGPQYWAQLSQALSASRAAIRSGNADAQVSVGLSGADLAATAAALVDSVDAFSIPADTNADLAAALKTSLGKPLYLAR